MGRKDNRKAREGRKVERVGCGQRGDCRSRDDLRCWDYTPEPLRHESSEKDHGLYISIDHLRVECQIFQRILFKLDLYDTMSNLENGIETKENRTLLTHINEIDYGRSGQDKQKSLTQAMYTVHAGYETKYMQTTPESYFNKAKLNQGEYPRIRSSREPGSCFLQRSA